MSHSAEDIGLAPRQAALGAVEAALGRRRGLEEALGGPVFKALEPRGRAFARMLAMTVLRRLGPIDHALDARLRSPPPEPVLGLLRIGAAQAFYMDTPAFAAVDTTVRLAEQMQATRPFKGLINGVLRNLLRGEPPASDPERLAPAWLYARWSAAYGDDAARGIAAAIAVEPATDLTLRDPSDAAWTEALEAEPLPGGTLRTRRKGDLAEWPGFAEGAWWAQDAAAAIPARLLHVQPGETALDLCAAPGGKTLQLASAGAKVTALDRSAARLTRLSENLARMHLEAKVITADAAAWADMRTYDAVLLDAPCSSTGTFRRHPDVLWAAKPGDIGMLAAVQARLLDAAARRVRPGGRLVYAVCSLEPEEGEAQVAGFLKRRPDFRLDPIQPGESGAPAASVTPEGLLRILPQHVEGGADGFFAARMSRRAD